MTSGHIAHNCILGDDNVVASCALVAGYVEIGNRAFLSGGVVVHQYSKIGDLAMIGGNTRVNKDVPPYFLYSGFDVTPMGINAVGLRRAGFTQSDLAPLKKAFRLLFLSRLGLDEALAQVEAECTGPHIENLAAFVRSSERGICRRN
jgi:UDP-N-acetylglucosamine acyltransferase